MSSHLVPGDHAFPDDKQLMADLASLNDQLSRYLLSYLAADALEADPVSVVEERALAETMTALAGRVQQRADRRTPSSRPAELEGGATLQQLTNGRPTEG